MEWTSGGPAVHFNADGTINRRKELKDKVEIVMIDGVESQLQRLAMKGPNVTDAYALYEEKNSGRKWAAVVLNRSIRGKGIDYMVIPESLNPPYYKCVKTILKALTPLEPGEDPGAEKWRKKCWEEVDRKNNPSSFEALPEGAQVLWTVGNDDMPFPPKGKKIKLVKTKVRNYWYWKDLASGVLYEGGMVPRNDYIVLAR